MRIFAFIILYFATGINYQTEPGSYRQEGKASYYSDGFHGEKTSSGERFSMYDFTAAHRTLPFNSYLRVTHTENDLSILVRVNDRGPFIKSRMIDLSEAAARRIGGYVQGIFPVKAEEIIFHPLDRETDSLYRNVPVMDCLGNPDSLSGKSISLWSTKFLLHALYIANDLYLKEDVEKVMICGRGKEKNRRYYLVLTGISSQNECNEMKSYYEKSGFMNVAYF